MTAGAALSWWVAGALVAPVPATPSNPPQQISSESIHLTSASGADIAGWHFNNLQRRGVVILLHGIREHRGSMLKRAAFLYEAGYSCILIDFRAHGESSGDKITVGYLEKFDVQAALNYAKQAHPNEKIAIIGVSMGGAAALLAQPKGVHLIVLESVYNSLHTAVHNRVHARLGVLSWLPATALLTQLKPRLGFAAEELVPAEAIQSIEAPVYIISGTADKHTTTADTKQLYRLAPQPKSLWLIEGASHEDLFEYAGEAYRDNILQQLERYLAP